MESSIACEAYKGPGKLSMKSAKCKLPWGFERFERLERLELLERI
jgi:hypothetical protein